MQVSDIIHTSPLTKTRYLPSSGPKIPVQPGEDLEEIVGCKCTFLETVSAVLYQSYLQDYIIVRETEPLGAVLLDFFRLEEEAEVASSLSYTGKSYGVECVSTKTGACCYHRCSDTCVSYEEMRSRIFEGLPHSIPTKDAIISVLHDPARRPIKAKSARK